MKSIKIMRQRLENLMFQRYLLNAVLPKKMQPRKFKRQLNADIAALKKYQPQ